MDVCAIPCRFNWATEFSPKRPRNIPVLADLPGALPNERMEHHRVRTHGSQIATLRLPTACMTYDPPEPAPAPTPNHVALIVRRHVQRSFGLQMKTEALKK